MICQPRRDGEPRRSRQRVSLPCAHRVSTLPEIQLPSDVRVERVACPMGCEASDRVVVVGADRVAGVAGRFTVVACETCGLMRTDPRPTPETIGAYYPSSYTPYVSTQAPVAASAARARPPWRRLASAALGSNASRLPPMAPTRALEIGCASGAYLAYLASLGWDVVGVEPSESAAEYARARGFEVHTTTVERLPSFASPFQLVVGWMVLEHVHDPRQCLERLHQETCPGAMMVVSVPNAGSAEMRVFGQDWFALQVPGHLFHYTPTTLAALMRASGWKIERTFHHRTLGNVWASLALVADRSGRPKLASTIESTRRTRAFRLATWPTSWLAAALGQTGRMTVWARRIDGFRVRDETERSRPPLDVAASLSKGGHG